jgi:hypothetical protein
VGSSEGSTKDARRSGDFMAEKEKETDSNRIFSLAFMMIPFLNDVT